MEFGRRLTVESEIDNSDRAVPANVVFDESGHFVLYATMLGIKGKLLSPRVLFAKLEWRPLEGEGPVC